MAELFLSPPSGLVPQSLRALDAHEPAATRTLKAAELIFSSATFPDDLPTRLEEMLARQQLVAERKKSGEIDLRSAVLAAEPLRETGGGPHRAFSIRVTLGRGPSIRPEDVLRWLDLAGADVEVCRRALYCAPIPSPLS